MQACNCTALQVIDAYALPWIMYFSFFRGLCAELLCAAKPKGINIYQYDTIRYIPARFLGNAAKYPAPHRRRRGRKREREINEHW